MQRCTKSTSRSWLMALALVLTAPSAPGAPAPGPAGAGEAGDDARCVDALFQLEVLAGDWKVYKAGPGGERVYLDDRDRPTEVERLAHERDATCSSDPDLLASQKQRASDLFQAMNPDCLEAREKLRNLQRPTARSAPSDIEQQEAWITAHCPDVSRTGVWLADWRYPQQKR